MIEELMRLSRKHDCDIFKRTAALACKWFASPLSQRMHSVTLGVDALLQAVVAKGHVHRINNVRVSTDLSTHRLVSFRPLCTPSLTESCLGPHGVQQVPVALLMMAVRDISPCEQCRPRGGFNMTPATAGG